MAIVVNPHNDQEEKVLLEILNNLNYDYSSSNINPEKDEKFLAQYNQELEDAQKDVEAGNFLFQEEVEKFLTNRRKNLNAH
jgi:hypothetical protein